MNIRWFVYDITGIMEDFVASFADYQDALSFGRLKFGDNLYVTDVPHHGKAKVGIAKKVRKRSPAKPHMPRWR